MNERPSRRHTDYGDFTEYQVGMFRLIKLEEEKKTKFSPFGFNIEDEND